MTWPNDAYLAFAGGGVYHTADFASPSPTWVAENDGLGSATAHSFRLDPHAPWGWQWLITQEWSVYRRQMGSTWELALSKATAVSMAGGAPVEPSRVTCDPSIPGRVWVLAPRNESTFPANLPMFWAFRSDDYGETWTAFPTISGKFVSHAIAEQSFAFCGDCGFHTYSPGANHRLIYTSNGGVTWTEKSLQGGNIASTGFIHPLLPTVGFVTSTGLGEAYLYRANLLTGDLDRLLTVPHQWGLHMKNGAWWYADDDPLCQRVASSAGGNTLYETADGWDSYDTFTPYGMGILMAPWQDPSAPGRRVAGYVLGATTTIRAYTVFTQEASDGALTSKIGNLPGYMGAIVDGGVQVVGIPPGHWQVYSCRYEEAS